MPNARKVFYAFLRWSGIMSLWRYARRDTVTILMIHGVKEKGSNDTWMPLRPRLAPSRLERLLRLLSRCYRFVTFEDAVAMVTGEKRMRPYCLAVTFDDGYRNNIRHALPILRKYKVPAAFFVSTGNIERRHPFWFDRLDFALQHAPIGKREVRVGRTTVCLDAASVSTLQDSYKRLREAAQEEYRDDGEMNSEIEELIASLEEECGKKLSDIFEDDEWSALMTWDEVRSGAGERDFLFQSHTVDHVRLGLVNEETIREQLRESKAMIERRAGAACRYLCYPAGSFTPRVAEIARELGYEAAVTTIPGANRCGDDPMTLRRINVPNRGSDAELLAAICGVADSTWAIRNGIVNRFANVRRTEAVLVK